MWRKTLSMQCNGDKQFIVYTVKNIHSDRSSRESHSDRISSSGVKNFNSVRMKLTNAYRSEINEKSKKLKKIYFVFWFDLFFLFITFYLLFFIYYLFSLLTFSRHETRTFDLLFHNFIVANGSWISTATSSHT